MNSEVKQMNTLIIYFSWSNNTKKLVEEINNEFAYDVVRIQRKIPYSSDYNQCAYIEAKEEWEKRLFPEIKDIVLDINSYERILLFFPIWWYTFPMPIATFVKERLNGYKGEVIVFANSYTNDPKYMRNCLNDIKKLNPNLNIKEGLLNKSVKEHISLIKMEDK